MLKSNKFNWINTNIEYLKLIRYLNDTLEYAYTRPPRPEVREVIERIIMDIVCLNDLAKDRGYINKSA